VVGVVDHLGVVGVVKHLGVVDHLDKSFPEYAAFQIRRGIILITLDE
jgi:hypothetical protein